jgi:hypothetical protein
MSMRNTCAPLARTSISMIQTLLVLLAHVDSGCCLVASTAAHKLMIIFAGGLRHSQVLQHCKLTCAYCSSSSCSLALYTYTVISKFSQSLETKCLCSACGCACWTSLRPRSLQDKLADEPLRGPPISLALVAIGRYIAVHEFDLLRSGPLQFARNCACCPMVGSPPASQISVRYLAHCNSLRAH